MINRKEKGKYIFIFYIFMTVLIWYTLHTPYIIIQSKLSFINTQIYEPGAQLLKNEAFIWNEF